MRSSQLTLAQYDSDKAALPYMQRYDELLQPWIGKKISLLELGIHKGGSLLMWHDYFPLGSIAGIDIKLPENLPPKERIHVFQGSQGDTRFLSRVADEIAPEGFDVIIDDASHIGELTKIAFWHLFDNHLKPNGLYAIEDWGTGYWDDWDDGKSLDLLSYCQASPRRKPHWPKLRAKSPPRSPMPSHCYGMVGFIKQLVDEQGAADVTKANLKGKAKRKSKFTNMIITPGIVFIRKADHQPRPR